jgi:hypothetical protein
VFWVNSFEGVLGVVRKSSGWAPCFSAFYKQVFQTVPLPTLYVFMHPNWNGLALLHYFGIPVFGVLKGQFMKSNY